MTAYEILKVWKVVANCIYLATEHTNCSLFIISLCHCLIHSSNPWYFILFIPRILIPSVHHISNYEETINLSVQATAGRAIPFSEVIHLFANIWWLSLQGVIGLSQGLWIYTWEHKYRDTSMPRVRFNHTIPLSERQNTEHPSRHSGHCDRSSWFNL